jgi:hypothetical protein
MNPAISSLQKAEKEVIVNFPIDSVKASIMLMFKKFPGKYILRENDINEVFNTYHFPISNNLNPAIVDMVLTEVETGKTKISISVTNAYGSLSSNSILAGIANDYLLVLGKVLSGESMDSVKQTVKNSGCLVIMCIGIVSLALMSFILL